MEVLEAEEAIREHGASMTPEALRRRVFEATGDQGAADRAYAEQVLAHSRASGE